MPKSFKVVVLVIVEKAIMSQLSASKSELEGKAVGRYRLGEYVTGGSFGRVHFAYDQEGTKLAAKLEKKDVERPQLILEFGFYKSLGKCKFIPTINDFGPVEDWNALVMELLGPSLSSIVQSCESKCTYVCTLGMMIQLLKIFEYMHDHGLLYRDTKPENFLLGRPNTDNWYRIYLIDLGFCKSYVDDDNKHIPFRAGKHITGTVRYISVNNHLGRELSRRDDLEALGYMIIYLCKGELPWQGVDATTVGEKYQKICAIKRELTAQQLCADMPPEFTHYFECVKKYEFTERPNYQYLLGKFILRLLKLGFGMDEVTQIYDWDRNQKPKKPGYRAN